MSAYLTSGEAKLHLLVKAVVAGSLQREGTLGNTWHSVNILLNALQEQTIKDDRTSEKKSPT